MAPQLLLVLHQTGCVSPASSASDSPADLWQHYGNSRARDEARRGVSGAVQWDWYQRMGQGRSCSGTSPAASSPTSAQAPAPGRPYRSTALPAWVVVVYACVTQSDASTPGIDRE
jgi:hypothetical protein